MLRPQKQIKRSQTVTDKQVQYGVIHKLAMHWAVFMVCNTFALFAWVSLFEQPGTGWRETTAECVRRFLPFFVISVALIPAFVLDTLKLTNRFAGPISRLKIEIANAAAGRPVKPLTFRTGDYWCEIAESFNSMASRLGLGTENSSQKTGP